MVEALLRGLLVHRSGYLALHAVLVHHHHLLLLLGLRLCLCLCLRLRLSLSLSLRLKLRLRLCLEVDRLLKASLVLVTLFSELFHLLLEFCVVSSLGGLDKRS